MSTEKQYQPINFLSWAGRMGRMHYFVYSALLFTVFLPLLVGVGEVVYHMLIAWQLSNKLIHLYVILFIFFLIISMVFITLTCQRLHDINRSGWFALLVMIPVVNLLLVVTLFFISGTNGENRFGLPPMPNSMLMRVIFWGCVLWVLFSLLLAFASQTDLF